MYSGEQIGSLVGGVCRGADWRASGISIDSRSIEAGQAFLALRGQNHDGHNFIKEALNRGASGVIADNEDKIDKNTSSIIVEDCLRALHKLGSVRGEETKGKVKKIVVTGSSGKTTSKEMLREVLGKEGKCHASRDSYNNHIGLPLSLVNLPMDSKYAVLEVGTSGVGEIYPLAKMVEPDIALITNINYAHYGNFASLSEIAREKAGVIEALGDNGIVVIDDNYGEEVGKVLRAVMGSRRVLSVGTKEDSAYRILRIEKDYNNKECYKVVVSICGEEVSFSMERGMEYRVRNLLFAVAIGGVLGIDKLSIIEIMRHFAPLAGRGQKRWLVWQDKNIFVIDDSYNSNPLSCEVTLRELGYESRREVYRKIAVLGGMEELGKDALFFHRRIMRVIHREGIDLDILVVVGENMGSAARSTDLGSIVVIYCVDYREVIDYLRDNLKDKDCIFLKGSRVFRLDKVEKYLRGIRDVI